MARAKEFDPEVALDEAMRLFWARGYDGTSTTDLVDGTGVARASLYATFGSKRDLYLACLDRYLGGAGSATPEAVAAEQDTGIDAVRALLSSSSVAAQRELPSGCFSVNATVEHAATDPQISRRLESNRVRLESTLRSALLRARREGQLGVQVDPSQVASLLLVVITGLKALARAGGDQQGRADAAVESAMALLGA